MSQAVRSARRFGLTGVRAPSAVWLAAGGAGMIVAAMIIAFPLGVAGDYPNHLARTYIESNIDRVDALAQYYSVQYGIIPDLLMDIVIPPFAGGGVYGAGAVLVILCALAGPVAGVMISRSVNGEEGAWLPMIGFATIFGLNLEFGFINFLGATGLALFAFLAWIRLQPGVKRTGLLAAAGLALVMAHALGFLLFGYLVLLWELAAKLNGERGTWRLFLTTFVFRDAPVFLPGLIFLAVAMGGAADLDQTADPNSNYLLSRAVALAAPYLFYNDSISLAIAAASFVIICAGLSAGLALRILTLDFKMAVVCAGLFALAFSIPEQVLGIWGLHFRFPPIFIIFLAASLRFTGRAEAAPEGKIFQQIVASLIAIVIGAQFVHGALHLQEADKTARDIIAGVSALPEGARVLPAKHPGMPRRIGNHAASYAVIEANAYTPALFTNTSPVSVLPEWRSIHMPAAVPLTASELKQAAAKPPAKAQNGYWTENYADGWPQRFSHVLWVRPDGADGLENPHLCVVSSGDSYDLYKVSPTPSGCG